MFTLSGLLGRPDLLRAERWQEKKSQHFQVFFVEDASYAKTVSRWAEQYYTRITIDLGLNHVIRRDRAPWLWDDRCHIYLYPDRGAYLQATGAPRWSSGMVNYRKRLVYSFLGAKAFLQKTLPHELAHILFREYVGFDNLEVPRWLDEGVAQYAEIGRRQEAQQIMRQRMVQGTYFSLQELHQLPVNRVPRQAARLYYSQAVTLIHFLLAYYGSRRFTVFCSSLRDRYPLDRALSFATSGSVQSLRDLESVWRQFMRQ